MSNGQRSHRIPVPQHTTARDWLTPTAWSPMGSPSASVCQDTYTQDVARRLMVELACVRQEMSEQDLAHKRTLNLQALELVRLRQQLDAALTHSAQGPAAAVAAAGCHTATVGVQADDVEARFTAVPVIAQEASATHRILWEVGVQTGPALRLPPRAPVVRRKTFSTSCQTEGEPCLQPDEVIRLEEEVETLEEHMRMAVQHLCALRGECDLGVEERNELKVQVSELRGYAAALERQCDVLRGYLQAAQAEAFQHLRRAPRGTQGEAKISAALQRAASQGGGGGKLSRNASFASDLRVDVSDSGGGGGGALTLSRDNSPRVLASGCSTPPVLEAHAQPHSPPEGGAAEVDWCPSWCSSHSTDGSRYSDRGGAGGGGGGSGASSPRWPVGDMHL